MSESFEIAKGHDPAKVPIPPKGWADKNPPPDSGWQGEIPSSRGGFVFLFNCPAPVLNFFWCRAEPGGSKEEDFLHKPPYEWSSDQFKATYKSMCWCKRVQFEFMGEVRPLAHLFQLFHPPETDVWSYIKPMTAKFCHCKDCQRLHGAPFQHAALFHKVKRDLTPWQDVTFDRASCYRPACE